MSDQKSAVFFGASRGIGRTLALEGAKRGIKPLVIARNFDPDDTELNEAADRVTADVTSNIGTGILSRIQTLDQPYIFWMVGSYKRAPVALMESDDIDNMLATHLRAMILTLREIHVWRKSMLGLADKSMASQLAYTLVVIGSISSYKLSPNEAVYAMAKAGQAAFLRNYAVELERDFPGSKILLVNCARLGDKPGEQKLDAGGRRIDPGYVARRVWNLIAGEDSIMNRPFTETNIDRDSYGPIPSYGPQLPEIP